MKEAAREHNTELPHFTACCRYPQLIKGELRTPLIVFTDSCAAVEMSEGQEFVSKEFRYSVPLDDCLLARVTGDCPRGFREGIPQTVFDLVKKTSTDKNLGIQESIYARNLLKEMHVLDTRDDE